MASRSTRRTKDQGRGVEKQICTVAGPCICASKRRFQLNRNREERVDRRSRMGLA